MRTGRLHLKLSPIASDPNDEITALDEPDDGDADPAEDALIPTVRPLQFLAGMIAPGTSMPAHSHQAHSLRPTGDLSERSRLVSLCRFLC